MSEKINVKCKGCGAIFHAMSDEVNQLRCPQCEGELEPADAAPLPEKENLEETVKEYTFGDGKTTPEEAKKIKEQLLPPGGIPEMPKFGEESPKKEEKVEKSEPPVETKKEKLPVEDKKPEEKETKAKLPAGPAISLTDGDAEGLKQLSNSYNKITGELAKVIVGQKAVIEEIMVAILAGGHCLLEGVPGLAKTLLIQSISEALSLSFKRIQFTPDLMPSDITGTDIIQDDPETGQRKFKFLPGPIFANIILADEINRTPPKTQAAMLEAMQEKQVSTGGTVHKLAKPFFVLATQNPLDQEGTYPLPEAQQDRFLFKIFVDYPQEDEEKLVIRRVAEKQFGTIEPVLSGEDILAAQELVTRIPVADTIIDYATKIVRATRLNSPETVDFVKNWVAWGCGPRASINLITAAKAVAALRGANCVSCEDVAKVTPSILRHRLGLNYTAKAEGVTTDQIAQMLLDKIEKYSE